jgi:hypothetical protein
MLFTLQSEEERLIAEQAVAAYREAKQAMLAAPHGRGLAVTEEAVLSQGRQFMASMMQQLMSAHSEAQKGGAAPGDVRVERPRPSSTTRPRS